VVPRGPTTLDSPSTVTDSRRQVSLIVGIFYHLTPLVDGRQEERPSSSSSSSSTSSSFCGLSGAGRCRSYERAPGLTILRSTIGGFQTDDELC